MPKRMSGLSDPYRSMASAKVSRGNGSFSSGRSGSTSFATRVTTRSTVEITSSSATKLISMSTWVCSGWRSPRRSSSR